MPDLNVAITLPDGREATVALRDGTANNLFWQIIEAPEVKGALEEQAKKAYPDLHYRHGNDVIQTESAGKVVDAFLENGEISAAEDIINDWVDEDTYYRELAAEFFPVDKPHKGWGLFLASAAAAVSAAAGREIDADDLREEYEEAVREALQNADNSTPLDQMKQALRIGAVYVAGKETGLDTEDLAITTAFGRMLSADSVRPDENFKRLLSMVNVSADQFRDAVLLSYGKDLKNLSAGEDAEDYKEEAMNALAAEWRAFQFEADPNRPALVTADQVVELLDNASYGGVPVVYGYVNPKAFLELPWDPELDGPTCEDTVQLVPERSNGRVLIGIHNFANGSGHSVDTTVPVILPLDFRNWHVDGVRHRYGIDSLYGLSNDIFYVSADAVPRAPALEPDKQPELAM